jgi:ubiquinone/menaquinone biosynthesis C-methylase UbiE
MKPIENADFGKTAGDYATHRAGFPDSFFEKVALDWDIGTRNQLIVDIGTGTGTLARGFASMGVNTDVKVIGIDPATDMLNAARKLAAADGTRINFHPGTAENTGLATHTVDIVTAGQCWHWFEPEAALVEIQRILKPCSTLLIAYFDWIPLSDNIVRLTEKLIERFNPQWKGGNQYGIHPKIFRQLGEAGFTNLESFTYDEPAIYTHSGWRGRVRASAGIGASLAHSEVTAFDRELAILLAHRFPDESLSVPHRIFALKGTTPG